MGWEVLKRNGAGIGADEPAVRLSSDGRVSVSRAALALMGNPSHVTVLVDETRALLALAPAAPASANAYKLSGAGGSRQFSSTQLRDLAAPEDPHSTVFTPTWDGDQLVFGPYAAALQQEPAVEAAPGEPAVTVDAVRRMLTDAGLPGARR